jgi:predicted nucleic acid-binding Zn ribbon protein
MTTKECEACGKYFEPTNPLQKYCEDCRGDGYRIRKRYDHYIAKSKHYAQEISPKIHTRTCTICGKEFKTTYDYHTCSDKCQHELMKNRLVCTYCGRNLREAYAEQSLTIPDSEIYKHKHFCNASCEKTYLDETCPERICKNCGKPYRNKNKIFCNRACQTEYLQNHKDVVPKRQPAPKHEFTYMCVVCKKIHTGTPYYRHIIPSRDNICACSICSEECMKTYKKLTKRQEEKDREKRLAEYIQENGMCGICRTPYSKCERMTSEFRVIPEGARYIDSKIQVCPKFTTKFK